MIRIMKASAGSGKTFNLARKYITLLFSKEDRFPYRHILAVTFTNKATDEMKSRILKELYTLSSAPLESPYLKWFIPEMFSEEQMKDVEPEDIVRELPGHKGMKITPEALQTRARELLCSILHDYSAFSISTIDRFFQQTLKAFTKEIGQFASYQVEIDKDALLDESVDRLLDSLTEDSPELLKWLTDCAMEQVEKGEKYNIDKALRRMAGRAMSDARREAVERGNIDEKQAYSYGNLQKIRKLCREVRAAFAEKVRTAAQNALDAIGRCGLTVEDFSRKFPAVLQEYAGLKDSDRIEAPASFISRASDSGQWFRKAESAANMEKSRGLETQFEEFCSLFGDSFKVYNTAGIIISQLYGQQTRLHYAVPRAAAQQPSVAADADTTPISRIIAQTDTANIKNPFVIPGVRKIVVDPQLNPNLTFATFIEGECNRLARSAGMSVAVNPGNTPFNPLYIYGDSGLGKTHIVQSIGHEVRQRHPELQVLYVSMNKFQAQFQTAYKNGEIPDFIHFYQMIDVLIIDDIQELTGKTGTQNAFFNIFNHLQLAGKQLILTSDKPPVELKDIEQRLLTRFKWGLSAQLNTPDYETKVKIIRAKARKLGAEISDEVVAYLADNISANVREIEGAISSLVANASFLGRKITTSLAKEILKVYVKLYQKEITIDHIIEVVCNYLNLDFARFNSTERTREIAQARQIAMYLAKQHTKAPLTAIGAAIGGRNHATVLHSCKAVTNLLETDKAFRRQVEEIEKKVLAQ